MIKGRLSGNVRITETGSDRFKVLLILVLTSWCGLVFAQEQTTQGTIQGVVLDALSDEILPFASIYKTRDQQGTMSDFEGSFVLDNIELGDTVVCSYLGFEKAILIADGKQSFDTIRLSQEAQGLNEVIILADRSILYELITMSRKTQSSISRTAKSYFELETFNGETQLELFQGYYNGTYQGYNTTDLVLKNGRFALAPLSKRIFASTDASRAMCMHQLMNSNPYFPISPFELNRKALKKLYSLTLASKYENEDSNTVYVINFTPKKHPSEYFQGRVWIDSTTHELLKVKLEISNAIRHPFTSIWSDHSLDNVSMELTKSFVSMAGEMIISSTDFAYSLNYHSNEDSTLSISSRAVLHPYNYEDEFPLPYFNFSQASNTDYRRIQMLPYNTEFWECENEFKLENHKKKRTSFINEQATIKAYQLFESDTIFEKNFFENPYVTWNGNRILIKGLSADSSKYYDNQRTMYADRYKLDVQLFLDINELCDTVQIITKTIFDPYTSFYHFETTRESQAFLNIYFDLMEIERRKLEVALTKHMKVAGSLEQVYNAAVERAQKMSTQYFKEVQRGTDPDALKKWNNIVLNELSIDNLGLFEVGN